MLESPNQLFPHSANPLSSHNQEIAVDSWHYRASSDRIWIRSTLSTVHAIDGLHNIFYYSNWRAITSPCCLLIASHDLFALQFPWLKIEAMESIYRGQQLMPSQWGALPY